MNSIVEEAMLRLVAAVLQDYAQTLLDQLESPTRKEGEKSQKSRSKRSVRRRSPLEEGRNE